MRKLFTVLTLLTVLPLGAGTLTGCSKAQDEVIENDPKESEAKRAEYSEKMRAEMQKNIPKGKGPIR
jgi:hypothetical protein